MQCNINNILLVRGTKEKLMFMSSRILAHARAWVDWTSVPN